MREIVKKAIDAFGPHDDSDKFATEAMREKRLREWVVRANSRLWIRVECGCGHAILIGNPGEAAHYQMYVRSHAAAWAVAALYLKDPAGAMREYRGPPPAKRCKTCRWFNGTSGGFGFCKADPVSEWAEDNGEIQGCGGTLCSCWKEKSE